MNVLQKIMQCCIDLRENVLRIGDEKVPFLAEKDLPPHLRDVASSGELHNSPESTQPATSTSTPSAASAPSAPQSSTHNIPEDVVTKLIEMGFSRDQALRALIATNGDPDAAVQLLLSM